jgi:hypothetical protein
MPKIRTQSCGVETANDYITLSFFRQQLLTIGLMEVAAAVEQRIHESNDT